MISELKFPFLVGDTTVLEVTDFKATCSSKGCSPFPEAAGSIYATGIVVDSDDVLPYKEQQQLTYPVQLEEDGPISYITMAGQLEQPSLEPVAFVNHVLTGGPPGLSLTGSLAFDITIDIFDVDAGILNGTAAGELVVCGL